MKKGEGKQTQLEEEVVRLREENQALQTMQKELEGKEKKIALMNEQMRSMLDGINEVIYVADPDTHELLFLNEAARAVFGDSVGMKCHKALQDLDEPCDFCTNHLILGEYRGKSYIWEWQNLTNQCWYRCVDKAIPWPDGRTVRYEMAIDVTEVKKAEEKVQKLALEVMELSTPVIQIWDKVVVAPLIGMLDSQRAQQFMDRFLASIVETQAEVALLDITGVPTVDTQTGQYLIETISASRLLGTQVVLTGVRSAIAQTLVHLGIDLSGISTRASLSAGLRIALDMIGMRVVPTQGLNKEAP